MRHTKPPTVVTMQATKDSNLWSALFFALEERKRPFPRVEHPDDLLPFIGVHVRANLQPGKGWAHFGVLAQHKDTAPVLYDQAEVAVLDTDQVTVWTGTVQEYEQMWCVD